MLEELLECAEQAWNNTKTPLDHLYDTMLGEGYWEEKPPSIRYRLFNHSNFPIACHICGATDEWTAENEKVFVCEHEPVSVGRGAIRQVSSVNVVQIGWIEEVL